MNPAILALVLALIQALPSILQFIETLINKKAALPRRDFRRLFRQYEFLSSMQDEFTEEQHQQWDAHIVKMGHLLSQVQLEGE